MLRAVDAQGSDRKALVAIGKVAVTVAIAAIGWYYLVPLVTRDADRDWWNAAIFGATIVLAIKWAKN